MSRLLTSFTFLSTVKKEDGKLCCFAFFLFWLCFLTGNRVYPFVQFEYSERETKVKNYSNINITIHIKIT